MRAAIAIAVAGLAGCSSGDRSSYGGGGVPGDAGAADPGGSSGCTLGLTVQPQAPIAGPMAAVTATVAPPQSSLISYRWHVEHDGAVISDVASTAGAIEFATPDPGIYDVSVTLTGAPAGCAAVSAPINVGASGARSQSFRMRIVPPDPTVAPAFEKSVLIRGGAAVDLGVTPVDAGMATSFLVTAPTGIAAYLRFSPASVPEAVVEGFADATGYVAVRLAPQLHSVLVIPTGATAAPRRFPAVAPGIATTQLLLDAGTPIRGAVRAPDGAAIAGATVQLSIDGVPSTVATTAADGSFTVGLVLGGATATVEVMPPAASGLPRLSASLAATALVGALDLRYTANAAPVALGDVRLARAGAPLGDARVTIVGSLPAGRFATDATAIAATGTVRIAGRTDPQGVLAGLRVSPGPLSAVVVAGPADVAVVAVDASSGPIASLEVPPMQPIATAALAPAGGAGLAGATLDLVPVGALAAAGGPELHASAGADGALSALVAPGGHYDLRFRDPAARAAPLTIADRVAASIATSYRLPAALAIRGTVQLGGNQALPSAVVQVLCDACSGLERATPIAEAVSDGAGRFVVTVPDPGTM